MTKFFNDMPAEFKQYIPDPKYVILDEYETRDENGQFHSYNDEPSRVIKFGDNKMVTWHSHGKIYRENNLPPSFFFARDTYFTLDENEKEQSYNGNPSKIIYLLSDDSFTAYWSDNGEPHREGDLPAMISIAQNEIVHEGYYENGVCHRANNRKAKYNSIKETWEVQGYLHNETGYAEVRKHVSPSVKTWYLYGVQMDEKTFNSIKTFQQEKNVPLWLAFLNSLKFITETEINILLDTTNNLEDLPLHWVLRSLGVTDETFNERVRKITFIRRTFQLKALEEIVRFNNQNTEVHV